MRCWPWLWIHIIHAEVKLMKCIADGMVVDISANQFGGLATLGFLEEVDAFIALGGIFKRSIILIKVCNNTEPLTLDP